MQKKGQSNTSLWPFSFLVSTGNTHVPKANIAVEVLSLPPLPNFCLILPVALTGDKGVPCAHAHRFNPL